MFSLLNYHRNYKEIRLEFLCGCQLRDDLRFGEEGSEHSYRLYKTLIPYNRYTDVEYIISTNKFIQFKDIKTITEEFSNNRGFEIFVNTNGELLIGDKIQTIKIPPNAYGVRLCERTINESMYGTNRNLSEFCDYTNMIYFGEKKYTASEAKQEYPIIKEIIDIVDTAYKRCDGEENVFVKTRSGLVLLKDGIYIPQNNTLLKR